MGTIYLTSLCYHPLKSSLAACFHYPFLASHPSNSTPEEERPLKRNSVCRLSVDEQMDLVCGIFWTAVFLLESNFEHEYLAGVRLLSHLVPSVIGATGPGQTRAAQNNCPSLGVRAEKMLNQMHFNPSFPGLLSLAIKVCVGYYVPCFIFQVFSVQSGLFDIYVFNYFEYWCILSN